MAGAARCRRTDEGSGEVAGAGNLRGDGGGSAAHTRRSHVEAPASARRRRGIRAHCLASVLAIAAALAVAPAVRAESGPSPDVDPTVAASDNTVASSGNTADDHGQQQGDRQGAPGAESTAAEAHPGNA